MEIAEREKTGPGREVMRRMVKHEVNESASTNGRHVQFSTWDEYVTSEREGELSEEEEGWLSGESDRPSFSGDPWNVRL